MIKIKYYLLTTLTFVCTITFAQTTSTVNHFNKVIVSPHIQVTFVEDNEESVTIENSSVSKDKIHIEVNAKTLRIYLDGAKELTKSEKVYDNGYKEKRPLYNGTVVTATVTYKTLNELSIRGEETQVCKSVLTGDKFRLKIYGESQVIFNEVNLGKLQTTIYGEGSLEIKSGTIKTQKYTAYGEGKINSLAISGNTGNITAYGEANFQMNVSDEIRITAFGEAKLQYKGDPKISKGLHFGEMHVDKID
ncbi:MAG: head GIN domain-containing protein [Ginsengibacter sp.]